MPIVVLGLDVLSNVYGAPGKCQAGSGQALTTHAREELPDLSPGPTLSGAQAHTLQPACPQLSPMLLSVRGVTWGKLPICSVLLFFNL